jgi:hypothetical protein
MDEMANQRDPIIIQLHGLPPTHTHGAVMFEHEPDCAAGVKWVNETEIKGCDCFAKPVGTLPYLN